MKKLVLVLGLVALTVSCEKRGKLDCSCDRIEAEGKIYIVDYQTSTGQIDTIVYPNAHEYFTINDCSKEIRRISDFSGVKHKVGDCY
jgi:hypothetical protein